MRAAKGEPSTRERLIAAAVAVVARDGIDKSSVKSIAAKAGITAGLVHYHFPSKEAMLEEALSQASADYAANLRALREGGARGGLVRAWLAHVRQSLTDDFDLFRVRLAFAARAMTDPLLAERLRCTNIAAIEETACLFAADRGETGPSEADRAKARVVKACHDGIMLNLLNDSSFPVDAALILFQYALGVDPD